MLSSGPSGSVESLFKTLNNSSRFARGKRRSGKSVCISPAQRPRRIPDRRSFLRFEGTAAPTFRFLLKPDRASRDRLPLSEQNRTLIGLLQFVDFALEPERFFLPGPGLAGLGLNPGDMPLFPIVLEQPG